MVFVVRNFAAILCGELPVGHHISERFYVLDGQLRVIRHWYHNISDIRAYVYRGKLNV